MDCISKSFIVDSKFLERGGKLVKGTIKPGSKSCDLVAVLIGLSFNVGLKTCSFSEPIYLFDFCQQYRHSPIENTLGFIYYVNTEKMHKHDLVRLTKTGST
jgi:hypothetical protein